MATTARLCAIGIVFIKKSVVSFFVGNLLCSESCLNRRHRFIKCKSGVMKNGWLFTTVEKKSSEIPNSELRDRHLNFPSRCQTSCFFFITGCCCCWCTINTFRVHFESLAIWPICRRACTYRGFSGSY